jgi:hypothetical protein
MGPEREGAGVGKVMGIWAIMEQALCISFASVHRAIWFLFSPLVFFIGSCVEIKYSDKKDSKEEEFISIAFACFSREHCKDFLGPR